METRPARSAETRTGCLALCLVAVLIASLLLGGGTFALLEAGRETGIERNEAEAVNLLRLVAEYEARFRDRGFMDADRDGRGEYVYLQELAGVSWRGEGPRSHPAADEVLAPRELGLAAAEHYGVSTSSGYHVLVYLPGTTAALPEASPLPIPEQPGSAADRQEEHWVAYAWPIEHGSTGRRAFVVNESGGVLATANDLDPYRGRREHVPEGPAAYDDTGIEPANLGSGLAWFTGGVAVDGRAWLPVDE